MKARRCNESFDTIIKNARVVRPNKTSARLPRHRDQGRQDRPARAGPSAPTSPPRCSTPRTGWLFPAASTRICIRHLPPARRGCAHREQGRGDGRRNLEPELHAHRSLLSQPRRPVPRSSCPKCASCPRDASGSTTVFIWRRSKVAHRRDGISCRRTWRDFVQDFHVLWRLWVARQSSSQNEFLMIGPEDRYDIAHFEFIMRSAQLLWRNSPIMPPYQRQPALRARRYPERLYQDRGARGQADRL